MGQLHRSSWGFNSLVQSLLTEVVDEGEGATCSLDLTQVFPAGLGIQTDSLTITLLLCPRCFTFQHPICVDILFQQIFGLKSVLVIPSVDGGGAVLVAQLWFSAPEQPGVNLPQRN